jgi:hypothetical protein
MIRNRFENISVGHAHFSRKILGNLVFFPHLEDDAGVGINIGPGVLDLASLHEHWGHQFVQLGDELQHK